MSLPRISVVVVTDHYGTIRRLVSFLREQTVRDQIEVVGYARGPGVRSQDRMDEYELSKLRFTSLSP